MEWTATRASVVWKPRIVTQWNTIGSVTSTASRPGPAVDAGGRCRARTAARPRGCRRCARRWRPVPAPAQWRSSRATPSRATALVKTEVEQVDVARGDVERRRGGAQPGLQLDDGGALGAVAQPRPGDGRRASARSISAMAGRASSTVRPCRTAPPRAAMSADERGGSRPRRRRGPGEVGIRARWASRPSMRPTPSPGLDGSPLPSTSARGRPRVMFTMCSPWKRTFGEVALVAGGGQEAHVLAQDRDLPAAASSGGAPPGAARVVHEQSCRSASDALGAASPSATGRRGSTPTRTGRSRRG